MKNKHLIFLLIVATLSSAILITILNTNDSKLPPAPPETATFYVGWAGGANARSCPSTKCEVVHSFREERPVELPYADFKELPSWVKLSDLCKRECYSHKSIFSTDPGTASITREWENRVVKIVCDSRNLGSGLLTWSDEQPAVITAGHVVENYEICQILLPTGGHKNIGKNFFNLHEDFDVAIVLLGEWKEAEGLARKPVEICEPGFKKDADISVFGYPDFVEILSASVVSGVISNTDEYQYFADVDIGPGYSGGVAVLKEENCYLGIPVKVSGSSSSGAEGIGNLAVILNSIVLGYDKETGFRFSKN